MVGTTASVSLIRDLVMNGHVTGMQADQWLTSLAFVAKPTADMIREIRVRVKVLFPINPNTIKLKCITRIIRYQLLD